MLTSIVAAAPTRRQERRPTMPRSSAAASERMSRVDTAWLRMDTDANLMMIVGVWLLAPRLSREALAGRVRERLLVYRPLPAEGGRGRHGRGVGRAADGAFDLDAHVVARAPAAPARPGAARGAEAARRRARRDAARSVAAAVAAAPGRRPRRRAQRADLAHPPLHRRRHRADLGHAVDHRRRRRAAATLAQAQRRRRRRR